MGNITCRFFSQLSRLAGKAIYFANVFSLFLFFLMVDFLDPVAPRPGSSEPDGPIFTKILGLIDRCKGLFTSLSFFDFSRDVATATN